MISNAFPLLDLETTLIQKIDMSPKKKRIFAIFHFPCSDGFGAAWSFYRGLFETPHKEPTEVFFVGDSVRFDKSKELFERVTPEDTVYFFDCCPSRDLVIAFHEKVRHFGVWDHHKTNQERCGDLPYCYFDMKRSGAGIVWDQFNKAERPRLINAIEDGDLWRWKNPVEKFASEITIVLESVKFDFKEWDAYNLRIQTDIEGVVEQGKHYIEYRRMVLRRLLGGKIHKLKFNKANGVTLPAVNAPIMQGGIGEALTRRPGPAGAIYYTNGKAWFCSLRSSDDGPDVSKIAEAYGGGGHRNAAAFKLDAWDGLTIELYSKEELKSIELELDILLEVASKKDYYPKKISIITK